jgi:transposase
MVVRNSQWTPSFAPGDYAQVDWGAWRAIDMPGGRRRISYLAMVFCHSRMLYVEFFLGEAMERNTGCRRTGMPSRALAAFPPE